MYLTWQDSPNNLPRRPAQAGIELPLAIVPTMPTPEEASVKASIDDRSARPASQAGSFSCCQRSLVPHIVINDAGSSPTFLHHMLLAKADV